MAEKDRVWYLRREGEKKSAGPFSTEQLLARWQKGELDRSSAAWQEGMLDWRPLLDLEPFASATRVSLDVPGVIRFYCECHNEIVMAERFAGRVAKCGVCGREVTVPDPYATHDEAEKKRARAKRRPRRLIIAGAAACLGILALAAIWYLYIRPAEPGVTDQAVTQVDQPTGKTPASKQASGPDATTEPRGSTGAESTPGVGGQQTTDAGAKQVAIGKTARNDKPTGRQDGSSAPTDPGKPTSKPVTKKPTSQEPGPTTSKAAARENVRAVHYLAQEFVAAFRTNDSTSIERLGELLADDCTVVTATGETIKGKTAVLKAYTKTIERNRDRYRMLQVRFVVDSSHVSTDSAFLSGKLTYEGRLKSRGSSMQEFMQTINFAKEEDVWRIIQIHATPAPPRRAGVG